MKKKLAMILTLAMVAGTLAACGGSNSGAGGVITLLHRKRRMTARRTREELQTQDPLTQRQRAAR